MPNTLSYNPDQTAQSTQSVEQLAPRFAYIENKREFPVNVDAAVTDANHQIDTQRHIEAQTALAKEAAVAYHPEVQTIPDQEQFRLGIGHAAVRTEWFRQEQLTQQDAEMAR